MTHLAVAAVLVTCVACATPPAARDERNAAPRVEPPPLEIVRLPPEGESVNARRCVVRVSRLHDGSLAETPTIVEGTGDALLDERCVGRFLAPTSHDPQVKGSHVFPEPLAVKYVVWVAPDDDAAANGAKALRSGGLSREEIQRVVSASFGEIKFCYERELGAHPSLAGKLVMAWVIDGTGEVAAAAVVDDVPPVGACVEKVVRGMRFPASKGGGPVFVTYPFVFSTR